MKTRLLGALAVLGILAVATLPSSAATTAITIVGFQFTPAGTVAVTPVQVTDTPVVVNLPLAPNAPLGMPDVVPGQTMAFTNRDPVPHKIAKWSGPVGSFTWTPFIVNTGATGQFVIPTSTTTAKAGTYTYYCQNHTGMRGLFKI